MFEIEIEIRVARGFGEYHKEIILEDLKVTKELEGLKADITVQGSTYRVSYDLVRVRLFGETVPENPLKEFVDWTCQYHEGTVTHIKNYKGGNQNGDQ